MRHVISAERVLVLTELCLGDLVMTLPLLQLLETRYESLTLLSPGSSTTVLAGPNRTFLPLQTKRGIWADVRMAAKLREQRFDIAILAKMSFRSAWVCRLAGIKRRIGHAVEGRSFLLTDPVPFENSAYYAFSMLDLARPLNFTVLLRRPQLTVDASQEALEMLKGATVGIQPGATYAEKKIPVERLRELLLHLLEEGHRVVLLGGQDEQASAVELCRGLEASVVNLVGLTPFGVLLQILGQLKLLVGGDTGVLHLGAAIGARTVQVFGPTVYKGWGNAYGCNQVVVAPHGKMAQLPSGVLIEAVSLALRKELGTDTLP